MLALSCAITLDRARRRGIPLLNEKCAAMLIADSAIACPAVELNDRIRSRPVSVSVSSYAGIETLVGQQLPGLIAPRQQAKWRDVIFQEEDDSLRAHAPLGVEPHIDR